MLIHVHLGAHKTGTSFLQKVLRDNRAVLAANGILVPDLSELRAGFTPRFDRAVRLGGVAARLSEPLLAAHLRPLIPAAGAARLAIVSDENLSGVINDNTKGRGLYPAAALRAKTLAHLLSAHEVHWYVCIRNYADYLVSAYLQGASRRKMPDFDAYLADCMRSERGWADWVRDLVDLAGPDRVTVWTYERFRRSPQAIFDAIAPNSGLSITEGLASLRINASLTAKGQTVMRLLDGHLSPGELTRMGRMLKRFTFDAPDEKLAVTDPALLRTLAERYRADRKAIRAMGCRFIDVRKKPGRKAARDTGRTIPGG
ncbi:hypothetical protein LXM94_01195 [Rhizobium sp. TRM95111]|uniref:hypothetical protein n=1 Tax=Rhizobium alarense TaxID=2846851 RepID=UPI001F3B8F39|nr:hypothetical protein [Rhizobium alarense]MCF3638584.1 hypothetical protein [Rhizobium alarense]